MTNVPCENGGSRLSRTAIFGDDVKVLPDGRKQHPHEPFGTRLDGVMDYRDVDMGVPVVDLVGVQLSVVDVPIVVNGFALILF
ncbi:MAG: hypothetical protein ACYCOR_17900 [Acidobacteriaceae bacterium]